MSAVSTHSEIDSKLEELCQAILDRPDFSELKTAIDTFSRDEKAQDLLNEFGELGQELQSIHNSGQQIPEAKMKSYETLRDQTMSNEACKSFMDAQHAINHLQQKAAQYIAKTYEKGRLPEEDDFSCGCGSSNSGGCCS
ncbi:MAG: YlbF family regulator [Verrucomicrobiota bacterium]